MIKIRSISKSYDGTTVLNDISLDIKEGKIFGIVGFSGAGKSTLLRCINRLEPINNGEIYIDSINVSNIKEIDLRTLRKNIGMIFQNYNLLSRRNVYDNIALPMKWWGYDKSTIDKKVKSLIKLVDLEEKLFSFPQQLSGGEKQRVGIARALALDPKLLLCDEPTSSLDPLSTETILSLLDKVNSELGITIVIVTHEMYAVKKICDEMIFLDNGNIRLEGNVTDIFLENPNFFNFSTKKLSNQMEINTEYNRIKLISKDWDRESDLLSIFSIQTGIKYKLEWCEIQKFKDKNSGYYILQLNKNDLNQTLDFFYKFGIEVEALD